MYENKHNLNVQSSKYQDTTGSNSMENETNIASSALFSAQPLQVLYGYENRNINC
jgi:hypothetical protein